MADWGVVPQTGLPVRGSYSFERGACSGRMIWRLSPGLFSCKRHAGFSECFGPHDFALVSHLSPATLCPRDFRLVSQYTGCCECFGPHDFAVAPPTTPWFSACMISGLSQLSPATLWILCPHDLRLVSRLSVWMLRMISHLSPTAVSHYTLGSLPA